MTTKENMSIGDRMLAALHKKGWSLSELSRRTGVPQPTIHRIGAGVSANPRRESIEKIARALGVSAEWLWTGREGIPSKTTSADISDISLWDENTPLMDDEIEVPFLREVELAAGSGRFAIEEDQAETLRFRKRNLRENGVQFNQAKCVTVRGNSMIPVLRDGATVGVDLGKTSLGDIVGGDLYAINHNGQLRVKQVFRLPTGLRLRSFNRDEYPDEDYTFQEIQDQQIAILGHVFWWAMYAK
ncbi:XRE family transcriptional regulator [Pseudomonas sp. MPB23]|uniref:XRE family transcriptional regulator n=1 Tax=Pseudomonas sp. MPB23 TaxID=3388490 RepID=UPI00398501BE